MKQPYPSLMCYVSRAAAIINVIHYRSELDQLQVRALESLDRSFVYSHAPNLENQLKYLSE